MGGGRCKYGPEGNPLQSNFDATKETLQNS